MWLDMRVLMVCMCKVSVDHVCFSVSVQSKSRWCRVVCFVGCCVLQCGPVCCGVHVGTQQIHIVWCCVVLCCSVLQRVAACCSMLQRVAACCSVLQCVAVCGNVQISTQQIHRVLTLHVLVTDVICSNCMKLQHSQPQHTVAHRNTLQRPKTCLHREECFCCPLPFLLPPPPNPN